MVRNNTDRILQYLIPPSLVILLTVTIIEVFFGVEKIGWFVDFFDMYIIIIFAIDLYYRWWETPHFIPYVKKHYLDIIATIPFNLIFFGIEYLPFIQGLRGVRVVTRATRVARFARYIRLLRFATRAPRFLRLRKHAKEVRIRKVQPHEREMKGVLSFRVILLVTINSIMGTGIWFLTAAGAKSAGPASLISWGILSLIAVYIAMCFSELTSMYPKAGGVYEFAKQTYGRFWSFIIGWTTSIAGSVTIAMLLLGALQYIIPPAFSQYYIPLAIGLILLFNYIAFRGMQTSTYMLVTFAVITILTVVSIIIPGFFSFDTGNFTPFFVFPAMNILLAIFFIAETFFGWESAIFLSAETKNPTKVMPKALIYGTVIIAVLAFALALSSLGVIPWQQYAESVAPLRDLGEVHFGFIGKIIFTVLVFTSIIGAVASWIVTAPRLLMSIAEDKLFFVQFAKIHPKHKSPYVSIAFQILVLSVLVIIGSGSYETLLHMLIPLILVVYCAVLLSVVILRYKKPDVPRPYRVIGGKVGPFITIFFMIFLLVMFIRETHGALDILRISGFLIMLGLPAYFAIEIFYDEKYVRLRRDIQAYLDHLYHKSPLTPQVYEKIMQYLGPLTGHDTIVDYNSRVGGFTRMLLQRKFPFRQVHILNTSPAEIKLIQREIGDRRIIHQSLRSRIIPSSLRNI